MAPSFFSGMDAAGRARLCRNGSFYGMYASSRCSMYRGGSCRRFRGQCSMPNEKKVTNELAASEPNCQHSFLSVRAHFRSLIFERLTTRHEARGSSFLVKSFTRNFWVGGASYRPVQRTLHEGNSAKHDDKVEEPHIHIHNVLRSLLHQ